VSLKRYPDTNPVSAKRCHANRASGAADRCESVFARPTAHCRNLDRALPACHAEVVRKAQKSRKIARAPRIRVPDNERAVFSIDGDRFVGVLQRLSLTGGSAVLAKGPIARGTTGDVAMKTVYGKVCAHIEFLQTGADGVALAQAFRFLAMDDSSAKRFAAAAKQMEEKGYSDVLPAKPSPLSAPASEALGLLLHSVRRLAATLVASRSFVKS